MVVCGCTVSSLHAFVYHSDSALILVAYCIYQHAYSSIPLYVYSCSFSSFVYGSAATATVRLAAWHCFDATVFRAMCALLEQDMVDSEYLDLIPYEEVEHPVRRRSSILGFGGSGISSNNLTSGVITGILYYIIWFQACVERLPLSCS